MSANQSNLSNPKYGYDMVVATTQASVNATMQEWLSKYKGTPFIQAYVYDPTMQFSANGPAITDFEKLKAELGFDPFTVPNKTAVTDQRIVKLMDKKFMFAFQIELGLPDFPLSKIPPVIQFNKEGSYVTYNMVCKTFKIIALQPSLYGPPTWINLSQETAPDPWVFGFTIDLDLRSDNINNHFHDLPPETQNEIKNLGEDMFSVQQLFLDLNAAGLSDSVTIIGLDKESLAYIYLTQIFINTYLSQLNKDGGIMLGFGVVSKKPFPENVSLIPTNLNFEISSYKDEKGLPTKDYNAYTLNYLIMAKGKAMPAPVQFSWNWVEKDKTSQFAGVMAVNRNSFITFLHDLLSGSLSDVARKPTAHFHCNCLEADFSWGFTNEETPQYYSLVNDGSTHVLTYSYNKSAASDDSTYCGIYGTWGNFSSDYTVKSDVYLEGTVIRVDTTLTVFMHLNVMGGVTEGNFAKKFGTTKYTIGADSYGRITVSRSGPVITDQSDNVDPSWWSKLMTLGQINDVVDQVRNSVKGWAENFLNSGAGTIENMLNSSNGWTFPGAKTYTFINAQFSDTQDLVANVLYIAPKTEREKIKRMLSIVRHQPELLTRSAASLDELLEKEMAELA